MNEIFTQPLAMSNNSGNNSGNNSTHRNGGYSFPDSIRRILLQTRAGRNSYASRMCDLERGNGSNVNTSGTGKGDKNNHGASSSGTGTTGKVSFIFFFLN